MDLDEQKKMAQMQTAFDASYRIYNFSKQTSQRSKLTVLFGFAAALGSNFVLANSLIPVAILTAAFMYDTFKQREAMITLSHAFNEVSGTLGTEARHHLKDIGNSLKNVKALSFDDINPVKHWERGNFFGLAFVVLPFLLNMPELIPAMIASLASDSDTRRNHDVAAAAYKTGENLKRLYPVLEAPSQPQTNEPPAPQA